MIRTDRFCQNASWTLMMSFLQYVKERNLEEIYWLLLLLLL